MWNGLIQQSEATAAYRRVWFHLVDATDGITAETGESGGQPQICSSGESAWANTSATLTAVGNGRYFLQATANEVSTVGITQFRYKSANTAEALASIQVVPWDPFDAVRAGFTALPNAAAEAAGGLYTRGSGAGQINQQANGQIDANLERVRNAAVNALQSGRVDSYVGATAATLTFDLTGNVTGNLIGSVGSVTGAVGSVTGAVGSVTGAVGSVTGAVGSIAAGGIGSGVHSAAEMANIADAILNRDMATGTDSGSTTVRTVRQALRALRNLWSISGTTLTVYKEDDSTSSWSATITTTTVTSAISQVDPAGP